METIPEIKREFLVRMGVSTTLGYYTETIVNAWVRDSVVWACGNKKWPFTEGRVSTTWSTSEETLYPEGWKPDSIRYMQLGGERVQKLDFESYQRFREDKPDGTDRVYSDHGNLYFINPNIDLSGTTTMWGQYTPYVDEESTSTPFSYKSSDGNEAILQRMMSFAKEKEKKTAEAEALLTKSIALLDAIWKQIQDEQYGYQSKDRGMFSRFDVFLGTNNDGRSENRFY